MPIESTFQQDQMEPWLKDIFRSMAERSEAVRKEPYQSYTGKRLADFPPEMQRAFELAQITGDYQPFLNMAKQYTERGAESYADNAEKYMNPYQQHVIDSLMHHSNRNFKEDVLPALEGHFVGLGQHGSTRHQELATRAARNQQESLNRAMGEQLAHGYESSGKLFNADAARALEAAPIGLDLARLNQAARAADIALMSNVGATKQAQEQKGHDIAYQEFLNQREHPLESVKQQAGVLSGMPMNQAHYSAQHKPGNAVPDTVAGIGTLATQLASLPQFSTTQRKAGGGIKGVIKKHSFAQSSFSKKPKIGGKTKLNKKPFEIGRI